MAGTLIDQVVNALRVGGVYSLIGIGFSMVFAIVRIVNFAHADIFVVGAFIGLSATQIFRPSFLVALLAAVILTPLAGLLIEKVGYESVNKAPKGAQIITMLGLGIFVRNLLRAIVGPDYRFFPQLISGTISLGSVHVSVLDATIIVVPILLIALVGAFLGRSMLGKAMRAAAFNREAVSLMGVNVDMVISASFMIGAALAGAGAVIYSMKYPTVHPYMAVFLGMKGLATCVIGGLGTPNGPVLGGFLVGFLEVFVAGYVSSMWRDLIVFGVLIAVLMVRPTGLLGERDRA